MVKHALVVIGVACITGCASRVFTKDDAIRLAKAEVRLRGRVIPPHCENIVVVPARAQSEGERMRSAWSVLFQCGRTERSTAYEVHVNPATGKVEGFSDWLHSEPL